MEKGRKKAVQVLGRVTSASGLLSHALVFVQSMLGSTREETNWGHWKEGPADTRKGTYEKHAWESGWAAQAPTLTRPSLAEASKPLGPPPLPSPLLQATHHFLSCLEDQHASVQATLASLSASLPASSAFSSLLAALRAASFDPDELPPSGLSIPPDDPTLVRCQTAAHSHALLSLGFASGSWAWTFQVADDITNDESICLGAAVKPVSSSSYNSSSSLWMYRCYNGNLYRRGTQVVGASKARIHPQDLVRIELDHEHHTLRYIVNGEKDQGVCFTEVTGEIFPAVAFYGANRAVRLVGVEGLGPGIRPGVKHTVSPDGQGRSRWEGEMVGGRRHGYGRLTQFPSEGAWVGTWQHDQQHGLQAWVEHGKVVGVFHFDHDVRKRAATERDLAAAVQEWDGWVCNACSFVSRSQAEGCMACGEPRVEKEDEMESGEERGQGGMAARRRREEEEKQALLSTRRGCMAAVLEKVAGLASLYDGPLGARLSPPSLPPSLDFPTDRSHKNAISRVAPQDLTVP